MSDAVFYICIFLSVVLFGNFNDNDRDLYDILIERVDTCQNQKKE